MTHPTYGISVADFGAPGDGRGDAAPAIQAALDAGAPRVYVPYGVYRIGKGLLISSHTHLRVHPEARLFLADGAATRSSDFLISNRHPDAGDTDISISGGIWDGNNVNNPRGRDGDPDAFTGTLINLKNVSGLELSRLRLQDSTAFFIRLTRVRHFRIEHIRFHIAHVTRNQDGIHCAGYCKDGDIHDIAAHGPYTTSDDLVAVNADDALLRCELLGVEAGPIRRLRISNLSADDCHTFLRLASVWAEISDIDIRGVRGGCRNMALNADALRYCRSPLFDRNDPRYADGVGLLKNIRIAEVRVHKTEKGYNPLFCLESRMDDFRLCDIGRDLERDACPEAPFLRLRNVRQGKLAAEYRAPRFPEHPGLRDFHPVAGAEGCARREAVECIREFAIAEGDHIAEMSVGAPTLRDLPPANNRVGVSVP